MVKTVSSLTVLFEEPYWVGVYERSCCGVYEAARIVFGAEPKDYEVYDFLLRNWSRLRFGSQKEGAALPERQISPKRMQRVINRQLQAGSVGTKAQQTLKLLQQQSKLQRQTVSHEQREEEETRRFELRQQKRREKHRGR